MNPSPVRPAAKLDPGTAWSVLTDAPLKGLTLAREAGSVFAWDEANQLYRIDARGQFQSVAEHRGRSFKAR